MNNFNINKKVNPKGLKKDEYDVIIIGAGIGGLTCGCYLAKAGMKVLIVEKNHKPGGYCTSFNRKGFIFDVGIHALEGLGENGRLKKIFSELSLYDNLSIIQNNPTDVIITNNHRIRINNNLEDTIKEFQKNFPSEKDRIEIFFNYIIKESLKSIYLDIGNKTFSDVLDRFISKGELRAIICVLLRNIGLPSNKVAAINAILFFRSYILQGGYYPIGGMRALADALCSKFKKYGGDVLFTQEVKKIKINDEKVVGVIIKRGELIKSDYVISNCDATHTFLNLVGEEYLNRNFINSLRRLVPTISTFIVYLGIRKNLKKTLEKANAFWFLDEFDADNKLLDLISGKIKWDESCIMISSPSLNDPQLAPEGKESIFVICNASFQNKEFWVKHRDDLLARIVKKAENVIPGLSDCIEVKETATPHTFFKYTLNREGAIHGWAPLITQIERKIISERTSIEGLFLTGHWITQPGQGGLPTAAQSGFDVAQMIMTKK